MATRKRTPKAAAAPVEGAATPDAIGRTLADYAERMVRTFSRLGYAPIDAPMSIGTQEWAKNYYETDGTIHRVTLVIATEAAGLSPARIESVIVTSQRSLPPNAERWIIASGSANVGPLVAPGSPASLGYQQAPSGLITSRATGNPAVDPSTTAAYDPYAGPYARDVAYLLRSLDIEARGAVADVHVCTNCKAPTDSWQLTGDGSILCPVCL